MRRKRILSQLAGLVILASSLAGGTLYADDSYCFENTGLKTKDTVKFRIAANRTVSGTYTRSGYEVPDEAISRKFKGTRTGKILTVRFTGKTPYPTAKGNPPILWSLEKKKLKITMHGKNYETGKYSDYEAEFEPCSGNH